jgi:hypothetical protein
MRIVVGIVRADRGIDAFGRFGDGGFAHFYRPSVDWAAA